MKLKAGALVIITFLIISAFLLTGAITSSINNTRYYALSKQLQVINFSMLHLDEVRLKTEEMVTAALGYAITGSINQQNHFYASSKSLESIRKATINLGTEATRMQVDNLSSALLELQEFNQEMVVARKKKDFDLVNIMAETMDGDGKKNQIFSLVKDLENFNRSQLRALESEQQSLASKAVYITYFISSFCFIVMGIIFYILNKELANKKLAEFKLKELNETLEEKVREKTSEVEQVFNRISDSFIALNKNWEFTYINKSAALFIGKDVNELLGKIVWNEFPESTNTSYYESCHKAMDLQQYVFHEAYYEPWDIYVENRMYPSEDGLSIFFTDVTELKRAEKAEKNLEKQLRAVFDNTNDIVLLVNDRCEYIQCNKAACRHLGYTKDQILKLTIYDLIEPTDGLAIEELWSEFEENGISQGLIKLKRKNGKSIECQYSAKANVLPGVHLSILTDVTKLIAANKKLTESKKRYQNAEKIGKLGHWELNLKDNSLKWSDEVYRIFGMSRETAPTYDLFLNLVHPDDKKVLQSQQELALSGNQPLDIIHRIILQSGQIRYLYEKANLIRDQHGTPIKLSGVVQDITERRIIEERTIESQRRLEAIFNGTKDAILVANDTGKYLQVNPAASMMLGYSQEELLNISVMHLMTDDLSNNDKYATWEAFKMGGFQTGEIELKRKDKQLITCHFSATANILPGLHLSIFTDITAKHKTEQELQLSYQQLQELTGRLQIVREEERIHIAREIHDELGQKLTGIKIDTSWLGKKIQNNDEAKNKIDEITSYIDDAIDTVRRISSELRPGLLEYFGLIDACESQSREFEKRHQIKIIFVSEVSSVNFSMNVSLAIYRIYQEVLTNIARHAHASMVETQIRQFDDQLILTVKDNGCGFDMDEVKRKHSLGLVGMRERAHLVKGELIIHSHENAGTLITLKIPFDHQNE